MSTLHSLPRQFHTSFRLSTASPYHPPPPPGSPEVGHHLSHAYSAYALSSAPEGAVIVSDGWGDLLETHLFPPPGFVTDLSDWNYTAEVGSRHVTLRACLPGETPCGGAGDVSLPRGQTFRESTSVYLYSPSTGLRPYIKTFHSSPSHLCMSPDLGFSSFGSVAGVYSRVSTAVFKDWNLCGKVMGLSTYGLASDEDEDKETMGGRRRIVSGDMLGEVTVDEGRFEGGWIGSDIRLTFADGSGGLEPGSPGLTRRDVHEERDREAVRMCKDVQRDATDMILSLCERVGRETGMKDLSVAGGLFLNSVANGRVLDSGSFRTFEAPPFVGDEGCAFGIAAMLAMRDGVGRGEIRDAFTVYAGAVRGEGEVEEALEEERAFVEEVTEDDVQGQLAEIIAGGEPVFLFEGRSEIGPRALGHRSILADPRRGGLVHYINSKVKCRESFRPFAPSVLAEEVGGWFEVGGEDAEGDVSPWMSLTLAVKADRAPLIPAVLHVDGTSRLQTVTAARSPFYHGLIRRFFEATGVPMVLNTSFNTIKGEPIVETPRDAFQSWLGCGGVGVISLDGRVFRRRSGAVDEGCRVGRRGRFAAKTFEDAEGVAYRAEVRMEGRENLGDVDVGSRLAVEVLGLCDGEAVAGEVAEELGEEWEVVREVLESMREKGLVYSQTPM